jgi:hypothetical protein
LTPPANRPELSLGQLLVAAVAMIALVLSADVAVAQPQRDFSEDQEFSALAGPKKHQKRLGRPIKLGTSGGNVTDFTVSPPFISCCSGTLGALIEKSGDYFVLSNNHVLAKLNVGQPGDPINQPGMLDNACRAPSGDFVATLTGYKKLKLNGNNRVDAAIAEINVGDVSLDGSILEIGVPGNTPVKPKLGMLVKKSGRTTGFTRGVITEVNQTGNVLFPADCSEDAEILQIRFIKQFIAQSVNNKDFSAGGDSGSMIYEDVDECPRPVGLLFAGGGADTVANSATTVIKQAKKMKPKGKASYVGCDPVATSSSITIQRGIPEIDERRMRVVERIQNRNQDRLLDLAGIHAIGIARSSSTPGAAILRVRVDNASPETLAQIPAQIDGVAVEVVESPQMRSLSCPAVALPSLASRN